MRLPEDFQIKMKALLKEEYDDFLKSYEADKSQGLRINTLKVSVEDFVERSPFELEPIPWVKEGFYYDKEERPGKHPYHEAGLYYIQEPSAMAAAELLDPKPGERILDLCAAPGGKTTHIAAKMNQQGFLLTNEIHPLRAKILSQNIERMGVRNAVVTNETPEHLSKRFCSYFDRILVDAPCSGEGMFRKDPEACAEWSLENVSLCAARQLDILKYAKEMLRPGGRLVYSTCTFSPEENERVVSQFLKDCPDITIEEVKVYEGFGRGRAEWDINEMEAVQKTVRIWPHKLRGEGHYLAVLKKIEGDERPFIKNVKNLADSKLLQDFFEFAKENLAVQIKGDYILFGEQLYLLPKEMLSLDNLKVIRPGWHLGTLKKNRFEPSHALALSLKTDDVKYFWNLSRDSSSIRSYLKGESLEAKGEKGWYLVTVDGYAVGWGKLSNQVLKNHYPKGLRWNSI